METRNVNVRLEADKVEELDVLAKAFDRDRSYLIKEAIDSYIALHRWQREELQKAVAEADAGDFASEQKVHALFEDLLR